MSIYFDFKTISELTGDNNYYRQPKEFTMEELSQYNGSNGNPAYVAIEGIVYDVSMASNWEKGKHYGLKAGQDLTDKFNECHGIIEVLNNAPKVGVLTEDNNMNAGFTTSMYRQVKPSTSRLVPDEWIRYVDPLVNYALREGSQGIQGTNARRSYQKVILLGVLVGLGRTPQEAINQVEQWQRTGASQLLGGIGTSTGMGTTGGTGTTGGMGATEGTGTTSGTSAGTGMGTTGGTGTTGGMGATGGTGTTSGTSAGTGMGTTGGAGTTGGMGATGGTGTTSGTSTGTGIGTTGGTGTAGGMGATGGIGTGGGTGTTSGTSTGTGIGTGAGATTGGSTSNRLILD
jgi:predicted heme/steroid binding protein